MELVRLSCGIRAPRSLLALAGSRFLGAHFETGATPSPSDELEVRRVERLGPDALPMSSPHFTGGGYRFSPGLLEVEVPEHAYAAEAALRIAWQRLTLDRGGLLLHASGVSFALGRGARAAVVAPGQSGDGKSTLARLCVADAGATLLSDEIIQVFPDGTCAGTPFRSDTLAAGAPCPSRIGLLVCLVKGDHERLDPFAPKDAFTWLMRATYEGAAGELPRGERARRVMRLLDAAAPRRLVFRKAPDVAAFVRANLESQHVDAQHLESQHVEAAQHVAPRASPHPSCASLESPAAGHRASPLSPRASAPTC